MQQLPNSDSCLSALRNLNICVIYYEEYSHACIFVLETTLRGRRTATLDVGESTLDVGEQTVGETTRRRNDQLPLISIVAARQRQHYCFIRLCKLLYMNTLYFAEHFESVHIIFLVAFRPKLILTR